MWILVIAVVALVTIVVVTIAVVLYLIDSNPLLLPPMLFVLAEAIAIVWYGIMIIKFKHKLPQPMLDLTVISVFTVIIAAAAIFTYVSVIVESVPINYRLDKFDTQNMSMLINREPTLLIPLKNAAPFTPRLTNIQATIYHNANTPIQAVELSTNDSLLSYPSNFTFVNSGLMEDVQRDDYKMSAHTFHPLTVNNATGHYTIDVLFLIERTVSRKSGLCQLVGQPRRWI